MYIAALLSESLWGRRQAVDCVSVCCCARYVSIVACGSSISPPGVQQHLYYKMLENMSVYKLISVVLDNNLSV